MKNKLLSIFACFLVSVLLLGALPCSAEESSSVGTGRAESIVDAIIEYQKLSDIQGWIDGYLSQNAGVLSEWYILALTQYADYDFSVYESALLGYLEENKVTAASTRLKYALCLAALGSKDAYISKTLNDSIGEQGLMSFVFGLHLLNNGYESDEYTAAEVTKKLLDLQKADGGWSVVGQYGDTDPTAMTLQALAPYYESDDGVRAATDKALVFLSEKQLDGGDFSGFGVPNAESTAQVLVALSSLGIDAESDGRFIKNGKNIFDGIEKYRLQSGGFCHTEGGEENGTATSQTFCAMVAYLRMAREKSPLYLLDNADPENVRSLPGVSSDTESTTVEADEPAPEGRKTGYKLYASLAIVALCGVVCVILFVLKKRNIKNFLALLVVCALAVTVVCVTDFRSADDYYGSAQSKGNAIGTVTISIRCDDVAGRAEHIPENGIILEATEFEIAEGDSVYTILAEAAQKYKIQLEKSGEGSYVYVSGINYLYEFDYGDLSGWTYRVNGERFLVSAGDYKLVDGDVIEWSYTTDLAEGMK